MICCEVDGFSNAQMSDCHFFSSERTTSQAGYAITGTADNGSGLVRLETAGAAVIQNNDIIEVSDIVGTVEANGWWKATYVDATHVDLQDSSYSVAWSSGGACIPRNYSMIVGALSTRSTQGLLCNNNYFDAQDVIMWGEFNNTFTNNLFVADPQRLRLISTATSTTAAGLVFTGNKLRVDPQLKKGATVWADKLLCEYSKNVIYDTGVAARLNSRSTWSEEEKSGGFDGSDLTPSVAGKKVMRTNGTPTITDFDDGVDGQEIIIIAESAVTVSDGAAIVLAGGADWTPAAGDTLHLVMDDNDIWYEVGRSDNTP